MLCYLKYVCGWLIAGHFHRGVFLPFGRLTWTIALLRWYWFWLPVEYTRLQEGGLLCFYRLGLWTINWRWVKHRRAVYISSAVEIWTFWTRWPLWNYNCTCVWNIGEGLGFMGSTCICHDKDPHWNWRGDCLVVKWGDRHYQMILGRQTNQRNINKSITMWH